MADTKKKRNDVVLYELRQMYSASGFAKWMFDYFAGRKKNARETSVDRLQQLMRHDGLSPSRAELVHLLRCLEAARCGQFVVGRKGHSSRLEWAVSMISVGQAAAGEVQVVDPLSEADLAETEELILDDFVHHSFLLRPGLEVRLALPGNLTQKEAARISDFVKTLPFAD